MNTINSLIILFIIKIVDNIIMTAKTITTYKNKKILSTILVVISQLLFYLVVRQIASDNTMTPIIVASLASGIGTYIAFKFNDKLQKDILWTNIITCKDTEEITKLCDFLIDNKIKHIVNDSYTRQWERTYSVIIFSSTKEQSRLIDFYLDDKIDCKYLRQILR